MDNRLKSIISRLNDIDDQYKQPLPIESLSALSNICPTSILPQDFSILNKICRCDFFQFFDFYNFDSEGGVIRETLYYRKDYNLAENYLVLFSDDVSFVLLKTSPDTSQVIWCDYLDFFNLCDSKPMEYDPTIFPTFTDFFEFLLDEEEKLRAEE